MAPDGTGPSRIALAPGYHVNVQLGNQIAESADIDLVRPCHSLKDGCGLRHLLHKYLPMLFRQIVDLGETRAAGHEDQPSIPRVIHEEETRERPVRYEKRIGCEPLVQDELAVAFPSSESGLSPVACGLSQSEARCAKPQEQGSRYRSRR